MFGNLDEFLKLQFSDRDCAVSNLKQFRDRCGLLQEYVQIRLYSATKITTSPATPSAVSNYKVMRVSIYCHLWATNSTSTITVGNQVKVVLLFRETLDQMYIPGRPTAPLEEKKNRFMCGLT